MVVSHEGQGPALPGTDLERGTSFGTLVVAGDGVVVHASAGAVAVLGETSDGLVGSPLVDLCAPAERSRIGDWIERVSRDAAAEPIRFDSSSSGGGSAESRAHVARADSGGAVIVEVTLGQLDSAPSHLADAVERLERTNLALSASSERDAADPRTSLAAAAASLDDFFVEHRHPQTVQGRPLSAETLLALGRLSAAVEESVSSARAGTHLNVKPVDGDELVAEAVDDVHEALEHASAEIEVGPIGPLMADGGQLLDATGRLLDNAISFRHPDRPLRVDVSVEKSDGRRTLVVSDNGRGIPVSVRDVLLGMSDDDAAERGRGMGLAICRRIAEGHGGQISIGDGVDGGVSIHLELPHWEPTGPAAVLGDPDPPRVVDPT